MATKFQKGQEVKVNVLVPQGQVKAFRMDEDGNVFYLVPWIDIEGNEQERWFAENQLVEA